MSFLIYYGLLSISLVVVIWPTDVVSPCPTINPPDATLAWYVIPTIPDKCFLFDNSKERRYSDASTFCQQFVADDTVTKASLVEPSTQTLQQAISSYAQLLGGKTYWTGSTDLANEGYWQWGSGRFFENTILSHPNKIIHIYCNTSLFLCNQHIFKLWS